MVNNYKFTSYKTHGYKFNIFTHKKNLCISTNRRIMYPSYSNSNVFNAKQNIRENRSGKIRHKTQNKVKQ